MPVTPGNPLKYSDLTALAALANVKTSLAFNVVPMFNDGTGAPWGHGQFSSVAIYASGADYTVGDVLTIDVGSGGMTDLHAGLSVGVVATNAAGGVLGIRIISPGSGNYTDAPPSSPAAPTGGTGTGCVLSFTYGQYGPTAPYNFSAYGGGDYAPNLGQVTAYYLIERGTGYTAGDTLGFAEQTGAVITVNTVDGAGHILTWTQTTLTTQITVPDTINEMAATGGSGSGATFGGLFTLGQKPQWLTELNRLRNDMDQAGGASGISGTADISGPWPLGGYGAGYGGGGGPNAGSLEFYFPDNGTPESVTLSVVLHGGFSNEGIAADVSGSTSPLPLTQTFEYIIGGDTTFVFSGSLSIQTDGENIPGASITTTFPVSFAPLSPPWGGGLGNYVATFTGVPLPPGSYSVTITIPATGAVINTVMGDYLTGTQNFSTAVATNGIHNSLPIKKITCPQIPSGGTGFSCGGWYKYIDSDLGIIGQFIYIEQANNYATGAIVDWRGGGVIPSTTCYGLFTGLSPMIANLNFATQYNMPWNLLRNSTVSPYAAVYNPAMIGDKAIAAGLDKSSNSYSEDPVESQLEPPAWKASTYFTTGFIIGFAGDVAATQYGYIAKVTSAAGISGSSAPAFSTTVGGTVTDGAITWQTIKSPNTQPDAWVASAVHPLGDTIYDSNGNLQTSVDGWPAETAVTLGYIFVDINGNAQQVTTAGVTGIVQPAWATVAGSHTTDGTAIWICGGPTPRMTGPFGEPVWNRRLGGITQDQTVFWKLTTPNKKWWSPAYHNPKAADDTSAGLIIPKYPVVWFSETAAQMKVPTVSSGLTVFGAYNQWQGYNYGTGPSRCKGWQSDPPENTGGTPPYLASGMAIGWWIYSVAINRIGANFKGQILLPTQDSSGHPQQVSVSIGCMRSGAFVAFGTYLTGTTNKVLWPIFTSDPLVYQCSERVDVQAVAIAAGNAGVTVGATAATFPFCAAFINDTETLLGLII